jgi:hypothetical protein
MPNETKDKLRKLVKENKELKKLKEGEDAMKKPGKTDIPAGAKKEAEDMDKDSQASADIAKGTGADVKADGATQDDMGKKYEEGEDMNKDTQASADISKGTGAVGKADGATQDDMGKKYEEAEVPKDEIKEKADEGNVMEQDKVPEDAAITEQEDDEDEMSDTDKIVEILEAMKQQIDTNTKAIQEMREAANVKKDGTPEAPISEKFKALVGKEAKKPAENLLQRL